MPGIGIPLREHKQPRGSPVATHVRNMAPATAVKPDPPTALHTKRHARACYTGHR